MGTIVGLGSIFTQEELYEINDAIAETLTRMVDKGISKEEKKTNSASHLMSAWKKVIDAAIGTDPDKLDWYDEYKTKIQSLKLNKKSEGRES